MSTPCLLCVDRYYPSITKRSHSLPLVYVTGQFFLEMKYARWHANNPVSGSHSYRQLARNEQVSQPCFTVMLPEAQPVDTRHNHQRQIAGSVRVNALLANQ